jgi:hypothetical protein
LDFHARLAKRRAVTRFGRLSLLAIPLGLALLGGGAMLYAQLDGAERGIAPVDSTSNFEVDGIDVDVVAANGEQARHEGWRRAEAQGWRMLWARTTGRPAAQAPALSESVLNSIVAGIVVGQEQIGPRRYVARLGVLFDRARTGQMLGVQGLVRRSAPMLVLPVMETGSSAYSFEFRNEWQRAWAQFRTAGSPIDYVRTSGLGIDPLLLNLPQARRRGRGWWRMILDQYGASDVLIPEVTLRRLYPGGPATALFVARFGPDATEIGRFELRAASSDQIGAMMDAGVRRLDALYTRALDDGRLRPDPSLVIIAPPPPPPPPDENLGGETQVIETQAPIPSGPINSFNVQVETPDAPAVQRAEIGVSQVPGVTSALTTSLALGGTSVMRVTYAGDAAGFRAALQAQGWRVTGSGSTLRIAR